MNILFLMISYPDVAQNTGMYTDLVSEFKNNGDNVFVIAPSLSGKTEMIIEGGVSVLRVKTGKLFNVNPIIKGISNLRLPLQYSKAINVYLKSIKFDLVITPTPPITFCSTIKKIKKRDGAKSYLILRDIFPQNAKDLGLITNPFLFNFFRRKEKKLYRISDSIGCLSQGNVDFVIKHNPEVVKSKLHLLPNWIKVTPYEASTFNSKSTLGIENKFIALYGGNIGKPQEAEFIIELAEEVKHLKDVLFLLIGDGTEKENLKELVKRKRLKNVLIKDFIPRSQYQELVKQCHIGLVNLSSKFTIPNIPCRTLAYFEAKLPILAAVDKNTDYGDILDKSQAGYCSITGDLKTYRDNFMKMYQNDKLKESMGENGYKYLNEKFNVETAHKTIKENVQKIY